MQNEEPVTQPVMPPARKKPGEPTTDEPRQRTLEERAEALATYWGRAWIAAWRTVFPKRENTR